MSGALFQSEKVTLQGAGLVDGERVQLEEGEPPQLDILNIRFLFGTSSGEHLTEVMHVKSHKNDSLFEW